MAVTVAGFRARFDEFTSFDDDDVERALSDARIVHVASDAGTMYVAAHFLAVAAEETGSADGGAGVVRSERLGPKSVTYATQAGGGPAGAGTNAEAAFYATTAYGRAFLALEARVARTAVGAIVVG